MGDVSKFNKLLSPVNKSIYPSNTIVKWAGTDTESWFEKKLIKYPNNKSLLHYKEHPIKYKMNNYGYRTPYDFKKGDSVNVYLGCSYTFGIGHHLENTWVDKLHNKLDTGFGCVNLAQGGKGIENQFRQLYYWKDFFKIKNIFHFQPIYPREELFINGQPLGFQVAQPPYIVQKKIEKNFFLQMFGNDIWMMRKYITNILAIENIANRIGVNYYYEHELPYIDNSSKSLEARDLTHQNSAQNTELFKIFYKRFKEEDTRIELIESDDTTYPNYII
jgi:hypothetical protein